MFLKRFQSAKLDKIERVKNAFEGILSRSGALASLLGTMTLKKSMSQPSSLSTSCLGGNFLTSTMIMTNTHFNNVNAMSANTSVAPYMTANSFLSSPTSRYKEKKFPYNYQSGTAASSSFGLKAVELNEAEESLHVHLLNQFLIDVLRKVETEFDQAITLRKPVSIDFNENLSTFAHLKSSVESLWDQKRAAWHMRYKCMDDLLSCSVEYLYDKNNRMCIRMPKCLDEPLRKCKEKAEEAKDTFCDKVFEPYNSYKQQLERNKLIQLKRNFFVHFYNYDAEKINYIMEQLNALGD